jgi:hypothetical protein
MNEMKFLSLIFFVFTLFSCKTKNVIYDYYEKENQIKITHYYLRDCRTPLYKRNCNNGLSDSLFKLFNNELIKLELPLKFVDSIQNKMELAVWKKNKDYYYYHHNRIDTSFILSSIKDSTGCFLVPFIHYTDHHMSSFSGVTYSIFLCVSIFIIKNNKIIYSMYGQKQSNSFFYVELKELDLSEINIKAMWEETVKEAMQPYLERLK